MTRTQWYSAEPTNTDDDDNDNDSESNDDGANGEKKSSVVGVLLLFSLIAGSIRIADKTERKRRRRRVSLTRKRERKESQRVAEAVFILQRINGEFKTKRDLDKVNGSDTVKRALTFALSRRVNNCVRTATPIIRK